MNTCVKVPEILLPKKGIDYSKWACVACDQFTSQPEYWQALAADVADAPSALKLILPEVYLTADNSAAIDRVNETMKQYLADNLFETVSAFVLVERVTGYGHKRTGLMVAVDLDAYSYEPGASAQIRATEGTVLDRIPPRVKIRQDAGLELPHILMLIDDRDDLVFGAARKAAGETLYDFPCNMEGGSLKGFRVDDAQSVLAAFEKLTEPSRQVEKYGKEDNLLFAVGDGNHSLATAKTCWENLKPTLSQAERAAHPARFALVEVVNIYDEGILFEPIYRLLTHGGEEFINFYCSQTKADATGTMLIGDKRVTVPMSSSAVEAVNAVDAAIVQFCATHADAVVDYIHGEKDLSELVKKERGAVGVLLPTLRKEDLFRVVSDGGVLPKKTFSMGEATEKRYYLEARKIK